jgi:hypothetical protein
LEPSLHTFSHVQNWRNKSVGRMLINIKFISNHLNCQTSILTNESPHTVDVCACFHRGGASRMRFISHRFLPIYKAFVLTKYLSTWQRIITIRFLNLFVGIRSALP